MTQDIFVSSQQKIQTEYKKFSTDPKIQQAVRIVNTINFDTATPEQIKLYMDAMVTLQSVQKNTSTLQSQQEKLYLIHTEVQKFLPTSHELTIYNHYLQTMQ